MNEKAKRFFKSDIFRCITVLLVILVIAGGLLAILNDVLYVSPEERVNRAVVKVYGKQVEATNITASADGFSYENGALDEVYEFEDDGADYRLFKATGKNGYKGGTVTLWILVKYAGETPDSIVKVILGESDKQTLMSKLTGKFYGAYAELPVEELKEGKLVTVKPNDGNFDNVVSGATMSSRAADNAFNTVLEYLWGDDK